ncbi:tetratricopeptide repeat protein [Kitasatospora purpeofusca]|uniref:tetratricopeptide repeat protein n=1 Tax=Kitasatospora purpeofusca TaxID=67352 RepID=UPI0035DD69D6
MPREVAVLPALPVAARRCTRPTPASGSTRPEQPSREAAGGARGAVRELRAVGPRAVETRADLAASYWQVGRTREAIVIEERVLADSERILGPHHPHTRNAAEVLRIWRMP